MTRRISKQNPHIIIVANTAWNIYNFRKNVVEKFVDESWKVTLLVPSDPYAAHLRKYEDVDIVILKQLNRESTTLMSNINLYKELKTHYANLNPDIILHYTHKPNIFGSMAAGKLGIPNISTITGLGYAFLHKGLLKQITTWLYRRAAYRTTQFIFENEDDLALFQSSIIGKKKGVSVKGCGVDTEYYHTQVPLSQDSVTTFTFIGRLLTDKGVIEYLKAAKLVHNMWGPKVQFQIIGQIDQSNPAAITTQELSQLIEEGNVDYLGFQSDIRPQIEASQCIVLPSYREGMPRTMMEALSMSRPVITTNVAGCREIVVDGKNGYLVEARSASSIVDAINQYLNLSYDDRVKMGEAGRQLALEVFDDRKIADEIFGIVEGCYQDA